MLEEDPLPVEPGRFVGVGIAAGQLGLDRLEQDHPRPKRPPVVAEEHVPLGTLDVDLEKLDLARRQLPGDLGQGGHRHGVGGPLEAEARHGLGVEGLDVGREAGVAPLVELDAADRRAADDVEIPVAGPLLSNFW